MYKYVQINICTNINMKLLYYLIIVDFSNPDEMFKKISYLHALHVGN